MKRTVIIFIILSFLGSTTEAHELLKLPHLVYHYYEHKSEHPKLTLFEFVHDHYCHEQHDKDEKDLHHDKGCLPFQCDHSCLIHITQVYSNSLPDYVFTSDPILLKSVLPIPEFTHSVFLASIWQPPKIG